MTENVSKFVNAGIKLDDAEAAIKGISNWAAVAGANSQQASHAMYNLAQALSTGYVQLIDWRSLRNAQMDNLEFLLFTPFSVRNPFLSHFLTPFIFFILLQK